MVTPMTPETRGTREPVRRRCALAHLPVVPGATLLGHGMKFQDDWQRLALLRSAAATAPVARMRFLHVPVLMVSAPEPAREVLVERGPLFEKAPATRVLLRPLARDGLFTSEGALWKSQRRLMSPLFHAGQLASYLPAMKEVTRRSLAGLRDGESLDLARLMTRITMGIVGATLFGTETFAAADELGAALTTTLKWIDDNQASGFLTLQWAPGSAGVRRATQSATARDNQPGSAGFPVTFRVVCGTIVPALNATRIATSAELRSHRSDGGRRSRSPGSP